MCVRDSRQRPGGRPNAGSGAQRLTRGPAWPQVGSGQTILPAECPGTPRLPPSSRPAEALRLPPPWPEDSVFPALGTAGRRRTDPHSGTRGSRGAGVLLTRPPARRRPPPLSAPCRACLRLSQPRARQTARRLCSPRPSAKRTTTPSRPRATCAEEGGASGPALAQCGGPSLRVPHPREGQRGG